MPGGVDVDRELLPGMTVAQRDGALRFVGTDDFEGRIDRANILPTASPGLSRKSRRRRRPAALCGRKTRRFRPPAIIPIPNKQPRTTSTQTIGLVLRRAGTGAAALAVVRHGRLRIDCKTRQRCWRRISYRKPLIIPAPRYAKARGGSSHRGWAATRLLYAVQVADRHPTAPAI